MREVELKRSSYTGPLHVAQTKSLVLRIDILISPYSGASRISNFRLHIQLLYLHLRQNEIGFYSILPTPHQSRFAWQNGVYGDGW